MKGQHYIKVTEKYYLLNKPQGVVSAVSDNEKKTRIDLIVKKDRIEGLYLVGSLDWETSGLLLIINNEPLGFRLLHPDRHVEKTYEVVVKGEIKAYHSAQFAKGIIID